jgi:hypothetical protein
MSIGASTQQLADEYLQELENGMQYYLSKKRIEANFVTSVLVTEKGRKKNLVGDVDFMVMMNRPHKLLSMLPIETILRPSGLQGLTRSAYMFEVKMSCLETNMAKKVDQFCSFYTRLLRPTGEGLPAGERNIDYTSAFSAIQLQHLQNPDTPVVFLYNHADNIQVEKAMRDRLGLGPGAQIRIHGHPVVMIWVKNLVGWEKSQREEDQRRAYEERRRRDEERRRRDEERRRRDTESIKALKKRILELEQVIEEPQKKKSKISKY